MQVTGKLRAAFGAALVAGSALFIAGMAAEAPAASAEAPNQVSQTALTSFAQRYYVPGDRYPKGFSLSPERKQKLDEIFNRFATREIPLDQHDDSTGMEIEQDTRWTSISPKDTTLPEFEKAVKEMGFSLKVWEDGFPNFMEPPVPIPDFHDPNITDPNRVNIDISSTRYYRDRGLVAYIAKDFFMG